MLALLLGRPVKFVATRHESFLSDIHAREQWIDVEVAAEADGTLTAIRAAITAPVGPCSAFPLAVDDCGNIVNPALVEGQIAGGIAQGLGGALSEWCVYDEAGQPLATTLMEYALPTAEAMPAMELHSLESPAPGLPGGFKGAGEAGTTGAPAAILNAVNDALHPLGVMLTDQPLTPERVWRAISAARGRPAR